MAQQKFFPFDINLAHQEQILNNLLKVVKKGGGKKYEKIKKAKEKQWYSGINFSFLDCSYPFLLRRRVKKEGRNNTKTNKIFCISKKINFFNILL